VSEIRYIVTGVHKSTKTTKMLCSVDVFVLSTKFRISTESGSGQLSTVNCTNLFMSPVY